MSSRTIFTPKILSLMPTWQCTAACTDCGTFSHPKNKTRLQLQDLLAAISRAGEASFQAVVFTGGEATLQWKDLLVAIEHATALGLSTRLVTNAWWGRTPERAVSHIHMLLAAGLKEINFSTGDEHIRFVPLQSVVNSIIASLGAGLEPLVMMEVRKDAVVTKSTLTQHKQLLEHADHWLARDPISESPWMPMDLNTPGDYPAYHYATKENLGQRTGCESLFSTHTLQADGNIAICCGLGIRHISDLQVGAFDRHTTSFSEVEREAEANLVRLLVKRFGPERLLSKLSQLDPSIRWEGMYAHQCQACSRVFKDSSIQRAIMAFEDHLLVELATELAADELIRSEFSRDDTRLSCSTEHGEIKAEKRTVQQFIQANSP